MIRSILVATFILTAQPAAACHHFSRWAYPWPQRCGTGSLPYRTGSLQRRPQAQPAPIVSREKAAIELPPEIVAPAREIVEGIPIPLPPISEVTGDWADGETAGRLILHALLGPKP